MQNKLTYWALLIYAVLILLSMATMSIGAALVVAAVLLIAMNRAEAKRLATSEPGRAYLLLSLLLVAACAITLVFAKLHPPGYNGEVVEFAFLPAMSKSWYLAFPVLIAAALLRLREDQRAHVLRAWLLTFLALSVIGIFQYYTGWPRPQPIPENPGRFHATLFFGHHLSAASILIFPFFFALDCARFRENPARLPQWVLALAAALGFVTLFLGFSRTLWVALPAGVLVWALWIAPRKTRWIVFAGVAIAAAVAYQLPVVHSRLHDTIGISSRQELWKANLEFFRRWPITGSGWLLNAELSGMYLREKFPGKDIFGSHAHNNFLHMLGGTGLLGTLPWLAWCLWILLFTAREISSRPGGKGIFCAWLVFQMNGLTQVNFWEGKVLHQMMWVIGWCLFWAAASREVRENA